MKRSSKKDATRNQETDKQRRAFLKLAATGGATAIASPWTFQSSRSAPRAVKIGMVSSADWPNRGVRRSGPICLGWCTQGYR